ncbi:MAG: Soluble epoxide hydrolase [Candidatus Lokiarchaeum sp. GC14_75]|nr:MAG: Soluble epoxide hydrolase [Candidatus Lokiarchaeum sp. GC14_75]
MPKANVNGIKISYKVKGEGYPLIFIHGFGSKKESFRAQVPILSEKFKVIYFDSRGAGKSERPNLPYSMNMFVEDIKGLMEYLKIKKTHLLGFSAGGMVAQNFVIKYPDMVNKLILINTLPKIPGNYDPEPYIQTRIKGLELRVQDPEKAFWESTKLGFYPEFREKMKENPKKKFFGLWSVEDLIEYYKTNPPTPLDIRNIAYSFKTHDTLERLSEIKNETLLLTASHDMLVPQARMFEIHKLIPNSTIKVMEKAGHESPKSKAPEVNQAILNFLG